MSAAADGTLRLWTLGGTPMGNFTPEETLGVSALARTVAVNQVRCEQRVGSATISHCKHAFPFCLPLQGIPLDDAQMAAAASADMKIPWRFRLDEQEIARANMVEGALPFSTPPPPPPSRHHFIFRTTETSGALLVERCSKRIIAENI
jgi:hypothetical protein